MKLLIVLALAMLFAACPSAPQQPQQPQPDTAKTDTMRQAKPIMARKRIRINNDQID